MCSTCTISTTITSATRRPPRRHQVMRTGSKHTTVQKTTPRRLSTVDVPFHAPRGVKGVNLHFTVIIRWQFQRFGIWILQLQLMRSAVLLPSHSGRGYASPHLAQDPDCFQSPRPCGNLLSVLAFTRTATQTRSTGRENRARAPFPTFAACPPSIRFCSLHTFVRYPWQRPLRRIGMQSAVLGR